MRILYISVHQALEYDELRMLHAGGHKVFSLGAYFTDPPGQDLRPPLDLGAFPVRMRRRFEERGGRFSWYGREDLVLPRGFVAHFDVCIVMHDAAFIARHWRALSRIPVVWRTIGVDVHHADRQMTRLREAGCHVVRYSLRELDGPGRVGTDAVIRFPKRLDDFTPWTGEDAVILKCYVNLTERLPAESAFTKKLAEGRPFRLAGAGNGDFPGALGLVSYETQLDLLRRSRVYFYGAGPPAPYTLNFMEAWLAGIPVVVMHPDLVYAPGDSRYSEIHRLITSGVDGFVVRSLDEAAAICDRLLADHALARRIGAAGARRAAALFDERIILGEWNALLARIADRPRARPPRWRSALTRLTTRLKPPRLFPTAADPGALRSKMAGRIRRNPARTGAQHPALPN